MAHMDSLNSFLRKGIFKVQSELKLSVKRHGCIMPRLHHAKVVFLVLHGALLYCMGYMLRLK